MFDHPLKLSKEGLLNLSDEDLAAQMKTAQETLAEKKNKGVDISVEEKLYEAYVNELKRRKIAKAKPSSAPPF